MDISMPEMNGAQATKRLKELCPQIKVLALTAHEDKGYLRHLIEAGAFRVRAQARRDPRANPGNPSSRHQWIIH